MTEAAEGPQRRHISIAHILLLAPWVAVAAGAWKSITDNSFLWHVRAGTLQAEIGEVVRTDPFSFTMNGETWLTQSWLVELFYGGLEDTAGGLGYVPVMLLLVGVATFATVGALAYRRSESVLATDVILLLAIVALIPFFGPRPVLFSYLFMALVLLAWDRPTARWSLPLVFWLWAGIHASFLIGLAYIGLMIIKDREWRQLYVPVVSALATLGTAHGLGVVSFLQGFGSNREALGALTEWRSPGFGDATFLAFLALMLVIVIGFYRKRLDLRALWLILPFLALGLTSLRAIPPAFLALVPLGAQSLAGSRLRLGNGLSPRLAAVTVLLLALAPIPFISDVQLSEDRFPLAAYRELEDVPTFHDDVVGGYAIWADWPDSLVYVDDRAELYGDRLLELVAVRRGERPWEPVFERDGIEQALLRVGEPLVEELGRAGWSRRYEDESFVILSP